VRGICEGVEHHLWSSDSHPTSRGIRALRSSKPVPRCTPVRAEGGGLLIEESQLGIPTLTLQSTAVHLRLWNTGCGEMG